MSTYTIGFTPRGYTLVRWVAGRATILGLFASEALAVAALVAHRAG